MKRQSRRYSRHRNPEIQDQQKTPFFNIPHQTVQAKEEPFFQPKLTIGQPDDQYEQEADSMANQVVNTSQAQTAAPLMQAKRDKEATVQLAPEMKEEEKTPALQKQSLPEEEKDEKVQMQALPEEEEKIQKKDREEEDKIQKKDKEEEVQKMELPEEEEKEGSVQMKAADGAVTGGSTLSSQLSNSKGQGNALPANTKAQMEAGFGADFSNVSIHTDEKSVQMNQQLHAQAFTHGSDIYFNAGKYDTHSSTGKLLLAHELTHVVQQDATKGASTEIMPYRDPKKTHFGALDKGDLQEENFDPKTDKTVKPWIEEIVVNFNVEKRDEHNNLIPAGTATAVYHDNQLPPVSMSITGGSSGKGLGLTRSGKFKVTRIEGVGYNDVPVKGGEGPHEKYATKAQGYASSMTYAVFFDAGRALHFGSLSDSSHGCVHVEPLEQLKQINYHSVMGLTRVTVNFTGALEGDIKTGVPSNPTQVTIIGDYEAAVTAKKYKEAVDQLSKLSESEKETVLMSTSPKDRSAIYESVVKGTALDKWDSLGNLTRSAYLEHKYYESKGKGDWEAAAEYLNAFHVSDIKFYLLRLTGAERKKLHDGALKNANLGATSQIAVMTTS